MMEKLQIKQTIAPDIPAVFIVLCFPILMMVLATGKGGVIMGLLIVVFFLYWIVVIYNKLYRKTLTLDENSIIYQNKEFQKVQTINIPYSDIKYFTFQATLMNNLTKTSRVVLKTDDTTIDMVNVLDMKTLEKFLVSKNCKKA